MNNNYSVIVFQMGKVGSKTVQESLINLYKSLNENVDVYHSHILCDFDKAEEIIKRERPNPEPTLAVINAGRELRRWIDNDPQHLWKVITLVRDPIARNVGTFFQVLDEHIPGWKNKFTGNTLEIEEVQKAFLNAGSIHSEPVRWFDEQLLPVFGVDVFAETFPMETGYKIYNPDSRTPILLIRLEDLDRIGVLAIKEFLGIDELELINANVADEKDYAELYRLFKRKPLPDQYIKEQYDTKYSKTFYSKADISRFTLRWAGMPGKKAVSGINRDPIIVYQMGKVGSKTVEYSLRHFYESMDVPIEIYHAHFLNHLNIIEENARINKNSSHAIQHIQEMKVLKNKVDEDRGQRWRIISLVRDPIARNIAAFFQGLSVNQFVPDWKVRQRRGTLKVGELLDIFLSLGDDYHNYPANWFDVQLLPIFHIDVFASSFPFERGYEIYSGTDTTDLLIIRMENINSCLPDALNDYLNIPDIEILIRNTNEEKDYHDLYNEFRRLSLPRIYVESIYDSKYARHFYTKVELETYFQKWTGATGSLPKNRAAPNNLHRHPTQQEKTIRELQTSLRNIGSQLEAANHRAEFLASQLQEIQNGFLYKAIHRYRSYIEKLLPYGTRRRKAYTHLVEWVKKLTGMSMTTPRKDKVKKDDRSSSHLAVQHQVNTDPIIIHQMGKVGSKTVEQSIIKAYEELGWKIPIYHTHVLNVSEKAERVLREERANPKDTLAVIGAGKALRLQIERNPKQSWKLISLVRDPVARNIGTFFHNLYEFIPDWQKRFTEGTLSVDELQEIFLTIRTIHNEPQWWFDGQMLKVFGIDVFASPFPIGVGYKIYRDVPRTPLLVIRLEDLNRCGTQAIHEFLGLKIRELVNTNIGEEKDYAELYKVFKEKPIPKEYLDRIYGTNFARHFYSKEEIEKFIQKWRGDANNT